MTSVLIAMIIVILCCNKKYIYYDVIICGKLELVLKLSIQINDKSIYLLKKKYKKKYKYLMNIVGLIV